MGGSYDNTGGGASAGKRPAPTIEGTATEVSVEPDAKEPGTSNEPDMSKENDAKVEAGGALPPKNGDGDGDGDGGGDTGEDGQPTAAEISARRHTDGRSFAAVLLGALTGFATHLAAGLVGGIAVLFALSWGYLPIGAESDAPDLTPLQDRIAKLEAAPETPDHSAALKALETRLGTLEEKAGAASSELGALAGRVAQLETSLSSLAEAAKEGSSVADAAAISQQINEAEKRLEAKIETALAEGKTGTPDIDSLKKEVAAIDAKLKALTEAELGSEDVGQLLPELAGLDERLGKIESTLPSLLDAIDEGTADARSATLAIAFANLRAAVEEGRPYAAELATLSKLSPGATDLGGMLEYEDTGIPTLRDLNASFDEAREAALSVEQPQGESSLIDRLMASAESLVKVRRVDETAEGSSTGAVLARAGAQLEKGDLEAAVKQVETLQGAPREAFAKWLGAAKARLDAEATLQRLENALLVSLGGGGTGPVEEEQE
jgi:hypothetical protein